MGRKSDKDLVGKQFGHLTVLSFSEIRNHRSYWNVRCDCGREKIVRSDLLNKENVSCGICTKSISHIQHGETKSKLYKVWKGMKGRCNLQSNNPHNIAYRNRNIKVCSEWENSYESFRDYVTKLEHYGEEGYSLDRIDNDGNYEPNNVRWATRRTQSNNTSANRLLTYNGKTQTSKEWAEELGINYSTIQNRIHLGWSDEDVLTRPIRKHTTNKEPQGSFLYA